MRTASKFTTYILESDSTKRLYIGQTNDIERRITQHQNQRVKSTKNRGPWKLLYAISFETRLEAVQLEQKLKKMKNPGRVRSYISK
jgi:putative endonuclease